MPLVVLLLLLLLLLLDHLLCDGHEVAAVRAHVRHGAPRRSRWENRGMVGGERRGRGIRRCGFVGERRGGARGREGGNGETSGGRGFKTVGRVGVGTVVAHSQALRRA